ncbi:MAG: transposase [Candidatus Marinimicrobia bacterium]|nr:transposase [Candidatus Neomarinimicrobiota bacterium]
MTEIYKTYQHNPPHLFRSNAKYFITGATYKKVHYLESNKAKKIFLKYLFKSFNHYNWQIEDWVVLDNHYHLMANAPKNADSLSQVINNLHRFASGALNKYFPNIGQNMDCTDCVSVKLKSDLINKTHHPSSSTQSMHSKNKPKKFHNYWDTCITYERSYFARLHYIWYNPVKHKYVEEPREWKFGSYYYRIKKDKDKIRNIIDDYPCDNVNVYDDF